MNYTIKKKHISTLLAAIAALSGAVTLFAAPVSNTNLATSLNDTVTQLNGLNVGTLPAGIQTVISNLDSYIATEQGLNNGFVADVQVAQADVDAQNAAITAKTEQINALITANPLDPAIATEQANLATLQSDLVNKNTTLTNAQSSVTNSNIKISLYNQAKTGPVASAQDAAAAAAAAITNARTQFATGGDRTDANATLTGAAGLQSVIDNISGVTAGDQTPVVTAITSADTTFSTIGAANASVADIQALVSVINAQLPTLPPISDADKTAALEAVLNGSYERNAVDQIQSNGIAGIVSRDSVTGAIHIGQNSLITNEVGGQQQLYAQDGAANPIDINVTNGSNLLVNGVSVATVNDVAAEALVRSNADVALQANIDAEATTRANADTALQANIDAEALTRANADAVLQSNIDAEATTRANADTALQANIDAEALTRANADTVLQTNIDNEAATRATADVALQGNIDAEAAARIAADNNEAAVRSAADTQLQANITAEANARIAAVSAEQARAIAAETALAGRATSLENRATALEDRTSSLEGRVGTAEREIRTLRKGIAMAAALQTPTIDHGDNMAVKVGAATYDGEQGLGLGFAARVGDNVTVNVDVATGFPETVARGGVNLSF